MEWQIMWQNFLQTPKNPHYELSLSLSLSHTHTHTHNTNMSYYYTITYYTVYNTILLFPQNNSFVLLVSYICSEYWTHHPPPYSNKGKEASFEIELIGVPQIVV